MESLLLHTGIPMYITKYVIFQNNNILFVFAFCNPHPQEAHVFRHKKEHAVLLPWGMTSKKSQDECAG